jgi:hypothetical protein
MRRYGVVMYFGGTCIAILIVSDAAQGIALQIRHIARALLGLCIALPLLGLANALAPLLGPDAQTQAAALQHSMQWWGGLIFTLFFGAIAWLWRATRFQIRFAMSGKT